MLGGHKNLTGYVQSWPNLFGPATLVLQPSRAPQNHILPRFPNLNRRTVIDLELYERTIRR